MKGAAGDMRIAIHSKWIKLSGLRTKAMFEEDFRRKHEWVTEVNDQFKVNREVPRWLAL